MRRPVSSRASWECLTPASRRMITPWMGKYAEIRCHDVKSRNLEEFKAYINKYTGVHERFLDPHFHLSGPVRLSFRSQTDIQRYVKTVEPGCDSCAPLCSLVDATSDNVRCSMSPLYVGAQISVELHGSRPPVQRADAKLPDVCGRLLPVHCRQEGHRPFQSGQPPGLPLAPAFVPVRP